MKSISQGTVELAHQVGDEEHRALEHADHDQVAPLVVAADLGAELGDPALQVLGLDQDLADPRPRRSRRRTRPQAPSAQRGYASAWRGQDRDLRRAPRVEPELLGDRDPGDPGDLARRR